MPPHASRLGPTVAVALALSLAACRVPEPIWLTSPAIATNGNGFIAVWVRQDESRFGGTVEGAVVDQDGDVHRFDVPVAYIGTNAQLPHVTTSGEIYVVVCARGRSLLAFRVDRVGEVLDPDGIPLADEHVGDVRAAREDDSALIAYLDASGRVLARVEPDGRVGAPRWISAPDLEASSLAVGANRALFVASGDEGVVGQYAERDGTRSLPFLIAEPAGADAPEAPIEQTASALTTGEGFFVHIASQSYASWRTWSDGVRLPDAGGPIAVDLSSIEDTHRFASDDSRYLVATASGELFRIPELAAISPAPFDLANREIVLAGGGGQFVVAWAEPQWSTVDGAEVMVSMPWRAARLDSDESWSEPIAFVGD